MKHLLLSLSLVVAGAASAHAQIYQPTVVRDSVVGAVAGALIGGHNHDRWAQGAVIGAAAGALVGATIDQPRVVTYSSPPVVQTTVVADAPLAPAAPMVGAAPTQVVYVTAPQRVVYVRTVSAPVCYTPAPVFIAATWGSGRYWRGHDYRGHDYHGGDYHHGGHDSHHGGGHDHHR